MMPLPSKSVVPLEGSPWRMCGPLGADVFPFPGSDLFALPESCAVGGADVVVRPVSAAWREVGGGDEFCGFGIHGGLELVQEALAQSWSGDAGSEFGEACGADEEPRVSGEGKGLSCWRSSPTREEGGEGIGGGESGGVLEELSAGHVFCSVYEWGPS